MLELARPTAAEAPIASSNRTHDYLSALEQKVLWLACWMIHNANHLRESRDGLKVGGHQASCASVATLMTALYFDVLRPGDRVAVKPHASPMFHAIQYLLGRQSREKLERFRAFGGAQAYPSRTKDTDGVDFSTGSVGLGAAMTLFASLTQDILHERRLLPEDQPKGRMVAIVGDAELDEGNVFEALLEGWKHDVRNVWWVIDYNRQSLDRVVPERLFSKIEDFFGAVGWRVVTLKYGKLLEAAFTRPDGSALRQWIDDCPNDLYAAITFKGGGAWREHLKRDLGHLAGIRALLDEHDDDALARLMTNLGGHDLERVLEAFHGVADDRPHCFIAYTIKGFGLPFAGHKDNHAGLMTPEQMASFKERHRIADGEEWEPFAGLDLEPEELAAFCAAVPFAKPDRGACRAAGGGAGEPAARPARGARLDPGGVRSDHGRAGARWRRARDPDHHHLARRHGVDQSRRLGRAAQRVQPRRACRRLQGPAGRLQPALGREPARPARRARHRREQSVPDAGCAGPRRPAVRRAPAAGRHALRPVHRPRARCADLCELPGRALSPGGDALGHHAGARRRGASVGRDQPDRHRPARPSVL